MFLRVGTSRLFRVLVPAWFFTVFAVALVLVLGLEPALAGAQGADEKQELAWIESLYQAGDLYRAESEILRMTGRRPAPPGAPLAELARAKLYYREGRYGDARLMLISLLDRHPHHAATLPAWQLLTFSELRLGNQAAAERGLPALRQPGEAVPTLAALREAEAQQVDADDAVLWSTFIPGAGFFMVDQPGRAFTALGLNLAFIGAAVQSWQADLKGVALVLLLMELTLYQGQRNATREAVTRHNSKHREQATGRWLAAHGEPDLLKVGIRLDF